MSELISRSRITKSDRLRPIAIDLFAGCGGLSLGLEASGFDVAVAVEFDPIHALIHHLNFPETATICQDIRNLKSEKLLDLIDNKNVNGIDLIAGGPPCQGFSVMGKRQLDDPRNSLVFEYLRIVKDLQPKYFIFENVPGIASGKHKQFLRELIAEFETIGYRITKPVQILDASLYGAPQKRKRLILLGSRKDVIQLNYPQPTHSLEAKQGKKVLNNVANAIQDLSDIPAFIGEYKGINSKKLDYTDFRTNFALKPQGIYRLCHHRHHNGLVYNHIGSNHTEKSIKRFQTTLPGTTEKTSRFLKLSPTGLCNTLRAGTARDKGAYTAPRPIHYQQARCITVREAARLHTFPDWFVFHQTIWHGFREIGNAVIPLLGKVLADEVIKCLAIDVTRLEIRQLDSVDLNYLNINMEKASKYWHISGDIIPKRKKLERFTV